MESFSSGFQLAGPRRAGPRKLAVLDRVRRGVLLERVTFVLLSDLARKNVQSAAGDWCRVVGRCYGELDKVNWRGSGVILWANLQVVNGHVQAFKPGGKSCEGVIVAKHPQLMDTNLKLRLTG